MPKKQKAFRLMNQKVLESIQLNMISMLNKTVDKRYLEFKSKYPTLEQRIPQHQIALLIIIFINGFKDTYLLDFLNLGNAYLEKNLEQAILYEFEKFILKLGKGFTFVKRQKRMIMDAEDLNLDLLFYYRKL